MSKAIVLLSGGLDSAATLAWSAQRYDSLVALSFEYYLRPASERLAVFRQLLTFPARLIEVPLPFLKEACDLKLSRAKHLPEGYVPNRNMIFYSIAAYHAQVEDCQAVVGGHNAGDGDDFPDASGSFFQGLERLTNLAMLSHEVRIELPLMTLSKREVLERARDWGVRFEDTWSCYWDGLAPCGNCASCHERAEAFGEVGIADPLLRVVS
jgi:7-cyano-7-deazaguanine synthase